MAYRIKRWENPAGAMARIADEQLARAVDQLEGRGAADPDEAVHDARKSLKKTRSALRLVRDDLGSRRRRAENAHLRDAGRRLAGVRDAHVLLETLVLVRPDLPPGVYETLAAGLGEHRDQLTAHAHGGDGEKAAVARELNDMRARVGAWPLDDESFGSLEAGLERIHTRGRAAMAAALREASDEAWHEWRKRVKDLWYSLRIVQPLAPAQLDGMVGEADALSELLGRHNDLAVLAGAVGERGPLLRGEELELSQAALLERRRRLRRAAIPVGRRLYAERPRAFAQRIRAYWDANQAALRAEAHWLDPARAEDIRLLLALKAEAHGDERRRIGARLRYRGFRVSEYREVVPGPVSALGTREYDMLVERGVIRFGTAPVDGARE